MGSDAGGAGRRPQAGGGMRNLTIHSGVSPEFAENMREWYGALPERLRESLADAGYEVEIYPGRPTDHFPHLRRVSPRGWGRNASWDDAEGFYSPREGLVAMFEGSSQWTRRSRLHYVLCHELGHAIDDAAGATSRHSTFWGAVSRDWAGQNPYFHRSDESFAHAVGLYLRDGSVSRTRLPWKAEADRYFANFHGPDSDFPLK